MKKPTSLRLRLTLLCAALLTLCCLLLTLTNNLSAIQMADAMQAVPVLPAQDAAAGATASLPMMELEASETVRQARGIFHLQSLLAMVAVLAAGLFLIYRLVGKALDPLDELARQIRGRTAEDLGRPLAVPDSGDEAAETRIGLFQKKRDFGPEATRDFLQIMEGEVDRLSALVESLLELTNPEAAERAAQVSMDALIRDAAGEAALSAAARDVSIQTDISPCVLPGNERLLHRAVFNLLENAVKHSPAGGTVRVSGHLADGRFRLDVSDQGPGIPPDLRRRIFEPFFRVDDARTRQQGGAGLGLALVQAIAEAHGGTVRMEERAAGGSRFILELPCALQPAACTAPDRPKL